MEKKKREVFIEAGKSLKTVLVNYAETEGLKNLREIEPYSFRHDNGEECICGYDIKSRGVRRIRLNLIRDIEITENTYSPRYAVELKKE